MKADSEKTNEELLLEIQELRKEIEKFRTQETLRTLYAAIENSPTTIVITDKSGNIEYANPAFSRITGYSLNEAKGKNPRVLKSGFHTKDYYTDFWATILSGKNWEGEFYNKKKDNSCYWEKAVISPVLDENKHITHFVAIKIDITEQRLAEERLKESEHKYRELNATKDKFFSIIAHDLKNPFNSILGLTGLVVRSLDLENYEKAKQLAEVVNTSTKNLYKLLENLLSWARTQTGHFNYNPELINVLDICNSVLEYHQISLQNKNIKVEVQINPNQLIMADVNMLHTIFRNLIGNAIKFSEPEKEIRISQKNTDEKTVIFSITDYGAGIPQEHQAGLFDIGQKYHAEGTAGETGTGLGLVLCKEFVEKHNGKIWMESTEEVGSTFYFSLPV